MSKPLEVFLVQQWSVGFSPSEGGLVILRSDYEDHPPVAFAIPLEHAESIANAILDQAKNPKPATQN